MSAPLRRLLVAGPLVAALALALIWIDVLPGGWRLRGWVVPHPVRQARERAEHAARRLALFAEERERVSAGAVVFLGSSTIERFPLDELFPGVACANRGIGNEPLPELLDRMEASLPASPPAGAVLYPGSIDFRVRSRPPERIAALAELAVAWLRARHAGLPVAVIGILPERDMPAEMVERLARTNAALEQVCARTGCSFVRVDRAPVTLESGSLAPEVAADRVHLNRAGYEALARWLIDEGGSVARLLEGG